MLWGRVTYEMMESYPETRTVLITPGSVSFTPPAAAAPAASAAAGAPAAPSAADQVLVTRDAQIDKPPLLNVMPPIASGLVFAGMDPKAIKDPAARRAYEEELRKNDERGRITRERSDVEHAILLVERVREISQRRR